jgi:hypothetical protein
VDDDDDDDDDVVFMTRRNTYNMISLYVGDVSAGCVSAEVPSFPRMFTRTVWVV